MPSILKYTTKNIHDISDNILLSDDNIELSSEHQKIYDMCKNNKLKSEDEKLKELIKLLKIDFGDLDILNHNGLKQQYESLKKKVIDGNKIDYIFNGLNINNITINNYYTADYRLINLTISSICRILLKEFFTKEEINQCCYNIINYNIIFE
jgi:hypothetical protein